MFEGLDEIDWESFGESHIQVGTKTKEIPTHIRNLLHEDEEERKYALQNLLGEGQHFGMLDKATPFIVPFILEALHDEQCPDRWYLLLGLSSICSHIFIRTTSVRRWRLALQIYDEIVKGFPLYLRFFEDNDTETRWNAAELLGNMQDHSQEALDALAKRLKIEPETKIRVTIIDCMLCLIRDTRSFFFGEGEQLLKNLFEHVKTATPDEKQAFSRRLKDFNYIHNREICTFVDQTLQAK